MGLSGEIALGASKTYTAETVAGAGAIKGKNCTISSTQEITGGHRVNFAWELDDGTEQTAYIDVMDGEAGQTGETGADGRGIKNSYVDESFHFIIVYDDDQEEDCGEITVIQRDQNDGYIPVGTVMGVFSETAPRFYLKCDGTAYNKADYPELSALLLGLTTHSQYEVDGDETKFKVPDLRGEFLRGTGSNGHSGNGNGANVGVHQDATKHLFMDSDGTNRCIGLMGKAGASTTPSDSDYNNNSADVRGYVNVTDQYAKTGVRTFTSKPTNTSVLYCIAYKDIFLTPSIDYSADEKLIGSWITGANLYQKTVPTGGSVPAGATLIEKITQTGYDTLRYTKA